MRIIILMGILGMILLVGCSNLSEEDSLIIDIAIDATCYEYAEEIDNVIVRINEVDCTEYDWGW